MKKLGDILFVGQPIKCLFRRRNWWYTNVTWRWSYFVCDVHWWNRSTKTVRRWNSDKPHRCPKCHTVVDDGDLTSSWKTYQCCQCSTRFTRWPRLSRWQKLGTCQDIKNGTCPYFQEDV